MRSALSLIAGLGLVTSVLAASPPATAPTKSKGAEVPSANISLEGTPVGGSRPEFRPSVFRTGPDSLVNLIDAEALLKAGQKDGGVMFAAVIDKTGTTTSRWTYRGVAGTAALEEEVNKRLETAKFTVPLYEHQPVGTIVQGTVIFDAETAPHVHIFLNQDPTEIRKGNDFISPQPVIGADSLFTGFNLIDGAEMRVAMTAMVDLEIKVGADGKLKAIAMLNEDPPMLGYAKSAIANLQGAKFIPAFRDGSPTECDVRYPVCYKGVQ